MTEETRRSLVFCTNPEISRPDSRLVAEFARISAANISDAAGNINTLDSGIQALVPGCRICGPACTVTTRVGDFLANLKGADANLDS